MSLALSATVIEAARTAVGEQLRRSLSCYAGAVPEIREVIARLVALDSVTQRAAERRVVASLPLQTASAPNNVVGQLMECPG